jgi:hypothetical protein
MQEHPEKGIGFILKPNIEALTLAFGHAGMFKNCRQAQESSSVIQPEREYAIIGNTKDHKRGSSPTTCRFANV